MIARAQQASFYGSSLGLSSLRPVRCMGAGCPLISGIGEHNSWNNGEMRREVSPGVCAYKKIGGNS